MKINNKKVDTYKVMFIVLIMTLLYAVNKIGLFKSISQIISIFVVIVTILLGVTKKISLDMNFIVLCIYAIYNIIILCCGFSGEAVYMVGQQIALLAYSFFSMHLFIKKEFINKISLLFSYFYYIVMFITILMFMLGMGKLLIQNISMTLYKAIFAISYFAYIRSRKKGIFCALSAGAFFIIGERTITLIFILIYLIERLFGKIKDKKSFDLIFIIAAILIFSFIHLYVLLPKTPIGIEINKIAREITGENFFSGRNSVWNTVLEAVKSNKLFGLTYNNDIKIANANREISTHNLYLWLILNGGYVLVILFYIYMLSIWKKYYSNINVDITRASAAYFIGTMVLVNFELLLLTNNFAVSLFLWTVITIGISINNSYKKENKKNVCIINSHMEEEKMIEKITYFLGWLLVKTRALIKTLIAQYNIQSVNGEGAYISGETVIAYPKNIYIGKGSSINGGQLKASPNAEIRIGENTIISYNVHIRTDMHNYNDLNINIKDQGHTEKDIIIGNNVWIGFGAQIMSGITIADGAVIAAGAVVTKNVNENEVVGGIPAKKIKDRGEKSNESIE